MIPRLKTEGYSADGIRVYPKGGGGGGATQSTVTNTNIPEYAKPYVETMLGATQQQLFNTSPNASGGTDITGIKPYQPYSENPTDYVAGFSPLQQQSFQGAGDLNTAQQVGQGSALAANAGIGGLGVAGQANPQNFQNQVGGYMNPYLNMALAPQLAEANRQYDISGNQARSQATQAGAFGGSREAIMAAENERNRNMGLQSIIGQGYNQAFGQAQNQYNQGTQSQLAGLGMANQAAGTLGQLGQTQFGQQQGAIGLQNQMGAQQQAQQQAQDPLIQMQQAELQLKQQEIQANIQLGQQRLQMEAQKMQQDFQLKQQAAQLDAQKMVSEMTSKSDRLELDTEKMRSDKELEGMRIGAQINESKAKQQFEQEYAGVKLGADISKRQKEMDLQARTTALQHTSKNREPK